MADQALGDWDVDDEDMVRRAKRRRIVAVAVAVALGLGLFGSGWVAASRTAPAASTLDEEELAVHVTALVEQRVLTERVTLTGTVEPGGRQFPVASRSDAAPAIVTAVPITVGDPVGPGGVVAEVSGRPLVVFAGDVPAYRQLGPGVVGDDVQQLEQGLAQVGAFGGTPNETYDEATGRAVRQWWTDLGYEPSITLVDQPPSGEEDTGGLEGEGDRGDGAPTSTPEPVEHVLVPLAEIAFVPGSSWVVSDTAATVGSTPADPVVTLAEGGPTLVFEADPALAGDVAVGNPVEVMLPSGRLPGRVAERSGGPPPEGGSAPVEGAPGNGGETEDGAPPPRVRVIVAVDAELEGELLGQSVRAEVTIAATPAEVLVVPLTALRDDGDGGDTVEVVRGEPGEREEAEAVRVAVTVGLVTATHAEVAPASEGDLAAGDEVLVE